MKKLKVKAFGITREILGKREIEIELEDGVTVADLRKQLESMHPEIKSLKSLFIAVNSEYAGETLALQAEDEIALIPPVSGG